MDDLIERKISKKKKKKKKKRFIPSSPSLRIFSSTRKAE